MASVKKITAGEPRETRIRKAKSDALAKHCIEIDSDTEESGCDVLVRKDKQKVNVRVTNNAEDSDLNLEKQYLKRFNACNREIFKIDKENGSANKDKQKLNFKQVCLK